MNYEAATWDTYFQGLAIEVDQQKVAKMKLALFLAGRRPTCCFFYVWALYMAMECDETVHNDESELLDDSGEVAKRIAWLFPHLARLKAPAHKVNNYIKELIGLVHKLSAKAVGASFRPGVRIELVLLAYGGSIITHLPALSSPLRCESLTCA